MPERQIVCRIQLFGRLLVRVSNETEIAFKSSNKDSKMLAYLAYHIGQSPVTREKLIDLLWKDNPTAQLRSRLNNLRSRISGIIESPSLKGTILETDSETIQLREEAVSTDVREFDHLRIQVLRASDPKKRAELLEKAVNLYRGDLVPDDDEEWLSQPRTYYRNLYFNALNSWGHALVQTGDIIGALQIAERAIFEDAAREPAHLLKIECLHHAKRLDEASQAYATMARAQDGTPSPEAQARAKELLGTLPTIKPTIGSTNNKQRRANYKRTKPPLPQNTSDRTPVMLERPIANLPASLKKLIGREREIKELRKLFLPDEDGYRARLVTLIGMGGIGKTELAKAIVGQLAGSETPYSGRVWFVTLADMQDSHQIIEGIRRQLPQAVLPDATEEPLTGVLKTLYELTEDKPCLLVLDNLEQLVSDSQSGTAAALLKLLRGVPGLSLLITSRFALGIDGEREYVIDPLELPAQDATDEELAANSCVALYENCARARQNSFVVTEQKRKDIAELCRKLEGIPLAIEIAASLVRKLSPAKMLASLQKQLFVLETGNRKLDPRHRSLRATIQVSYDLLTPEWQRIVAKLSQFYDWSMAAADVVCESDMEHDIDRLASVSMVVMDVTKDPLRYHMLEPIREFAAEKFAELPDAAETRRKYARYFLKFVQGCRVDYDGLKQKAAFDAVEQDHINIMTALKWCGDGVDDKQTNLEIAAAVWYFWLHRGYMQTGHILLDALLHDASMVSPMVRADALNGAAALAQVRGDYDVAQERLEECLSLFQQENYKRGVANAQGNLAMLAYNQGRYAEARQRFIDCREQQQQSDDKTGLIQTYINLGNAAIRLDEYDEARMWLEQGLRLSPESNNTLPTATILLNQAALDLRANELINGRAKLIRVVNLSSELDNPILAICTLESFVELAMMQGYEERAAQLGGAANALRATLGAHLSDAEQKEHQANLDASRSSIGETAFAAAWNRGKAMKMDEAIKYALSNP